MMRGHNKPFAAATATDKQVRAVWTDTSQLDQYACLRTQRPDKGHDRKWVCFLLEKERKRRVPAQATVDKAPSRNAVSSGSVGLRLVSKDVKVSAM